MTMLLSYNDMIIMKVLIKTIINFNLQTLLNKNKNQSSSNRNYKINTKFKKDLQLNHQEYFTDRQTIEMKAYGNKTRKLTVSCSIKNNLALLKSQLIQRDSQGQTDNSSMFYSDDEQLDIKATQSYQTGFQLIQDLINNFDNMFKSLLIYSKLIETNSTINNLINQFQNKEDDRNSSLQRIFQFTTFHQSLHKLFQKYLINRVKLGQFYSRVNRNKIIDVFYKYIYSQDQNIKIENVWSFLKQKNQFQSIGEWFKIQALENLLVNYISEKKEYTKFMVNFMKYGISYLFACCSKIIKKQSISKISQNQIEVINLSVIAKLSL